VRSCAKARPEIVDLLRFHGCLHGAAAHGTFPLPPRYLRDGGLERMPISRNWLFLLIGALIVAVAALGFKVYQDHREPKGVQLNFGPSGISVQKK